MFNKLKYILLNDMQSIFYNKKKYVILYYLFFSLMILTASFVRYDFTENLFIGEIGLQFDLLGDYFINLFFLLHFSFMIYINIYLFTTNLRYGVENIFLRQRLSHWLFYKIMSNSILLFLLKFIIYIILFLTFKGKFINFYYLDILFSLFIQLLSLFIYILFNRNNLIGSFFLLLISIIVIKIGIHAYFIKHHIIELFLFLIVIGILSYKLISKKIFEMK